MTDAMGGERSFYASSTAGGSARIARLDMDIPYDGTPSKPSDARVTFCRSLCHCRGLSV